MNDVKTVQVDQEYVDNLQRADIEQSARREIILAALDRGMSLQSESFQKYQQEFIDWYYKFSAAKTEIENLYVQPLNTEGHTAVKWSLDYQSKTLIIQY